MCEKGPRQCTLRRRSRIDNRKQYNNKAMATTGQAFTMKMTHPVVFLFVFLALVNPVTGQVTTAPTTPRVNATTTPTGRPTTMPTPSPTAVPTMGPTTLAPTWRPTSAPSTSRPTTVMPTTEWPTMAPIIGTRSPVKATVSPTMGPSAAPSSAPTVAPTLPMQRFEYTAKMQLQPMPGPLDQSQRIDWEFTTEAHIEENLKSRDDMKDVTELEVATDVEVQQLLRPLNGQRMRTLRMLQTDSVVQQYALEIEFVVRVTFRSIKKDYNVRSMVGEAFNSVAEKNRYIQRLQSTSSQQAFLNVANVEVTVEGQSVPPELDENPKEEENDVMLYIIAAAGGGCALVVAGLVFLYCTRKSSNADSSPPSPKKRDDITTSASDRSPFGLAADILVVNKNDDISTLGDPVPIMTHSSPDEQTASIGNDYDYSREYRRAHGIPSDAGSLERNESVGSRTNNSASFFSSEHSLDFLLDGDPRLIHRFEVTVPPGKLGIVMDNSPSGTPMVFAVKPESVLARDVQVGDRLLSVDQEDVTVMSAIQVSKLISLKNDQERTLVFCRKKSSEDAQDL